MTRRLMANWLLTIENREEFQKFFEEVSTAKEAMDGAICELGHEYDLVRCKNCMRKKPLDEQEIDSDTLTRLGLTGWCSWNKAFVKDSDFCSGALRRHDG